MADKQFIFGVIDNEQDEIAFRSFDQSTDLVDYICGMKGCDIHEIQEDCIEMGELLHR